ncbi:hypothetical protein T439DRAFT_376825, partial [Meredithblackwellia eburnea MCA 4105]
AFHHFDRPCSSSSHPRFQVGHSSDPGQRLPDCLPSSLRCFRGRQHWLRGTQCRRNRQCQVSLHPKRQVHSPGLHKLSLPGWRQHLQRYCVKAWYPIHGSLRLPRRPLRHFSLRLLHLHLLVLAHQCRRWEDHFQLHVHVHLLGSQVRWRFLGKQRQGRSRGHARGWIRTPWRRAGCRLWWLGALS